jgi:hypothetical protein
MAASIDPTVVHWRFTPMVVPQSMTGPVTLEVKTANSPSSVTLALASGSVISLLDDGSGVDAVAADGIYSVALAASDVLYGFAADDVNRKFVGYLRLFQGTTQVGQWNLFIDVLTLDIPSVTIRAASPDVQYSDHLVNVVDPTFFPQNFASFLPGDKKVGRTFYTHFPDIYDFLNIISEISFPRNRGHIVIQNNVANIGVFVGNSPDASVGGPTAWGSATRLLGATEFPMPTGFDGANWGYLHELGHQWVNHLTVSPLKAGPGAHWPLSDLASDIMGYENASSPQGLRFDFDLVPSGSDYVMVPNSSPKVYSDLSLYLMGLAAPSEVGNHFVFDNQNQPIASPLQGPVTTVTIDAVIAAMGLRTPVYAAAPTKFRMATILVSRDGLVSADVMRLYDYFAARAEGLNAVPVHEGLVKELANPFAAATRGRGRLDTSIKHRVLVDASRDGGVWWFPQTVWFDPTRPHQGKGLADHLRSHGYLVDELSRTSNIISALSQPYDIVIRAGGGGSYTTEEISAYQKYVNTGGRLLLLADHSAHAPSDGVAESFGIQFGGVTRGTNRLTRYAPHPITTGAGSLFYNGGSAVLGYSPLARIVGNLSPTTYLDLNNNGVQDAGEPIAPNALGVMGRGTGRIVFCGDVNLWEMLPQPLLNNVLAWFEEP